MNKISIEALAIACVFGGTTFLMSYFKASEIRANYTEPGTAIAATVNTIQE